MVAAATLCVSCVDESYDLDNIDMTLGIGQEGTVLWLPNCSTDSILLRNIMKPGGVVKMVWNEDIKDSIYSIQTEGYDNMDIVGYPNGTITIYDGMRVNMEMKDMPDFLNENDVVLDLDNPIISIETINGSDADLDIDVTFSTLYKKELFKSTQQKQYTVAKKATETCYMAERKDDSSLNPYRAEKFYELKGLSDVLWKQDAKNCIPDEMVVNVDRITFHFSPFAFGKTPLRLNYKLFAPLNFGENFKISYKNQETGFAEDLQDADFDAKMIVIEALCNNSMPLDVTVSAVPLDQNGNVIEGLSLTKSIDVAANKKDHAIRLELKPKSGHTLKEYMQGTHGIQFDGIEYHAEGKANGNKDVLTRTTHISLHNVRVGISGIIIDAN